MSWFTMMVASARKQRAQRRAKPEPPEPTLEVDGRVYTAERIRGLLRERTRIAEEHAAAVLRYQKALYAADPFTELEKPDGA